MQYGETDNLIYKKKKKKGRTCINKLLEKTIKNSMMLIYKKKIA